jgi:hypothetical protein
MKRIDLLIQLVKNIYKLLKTHLDTPCYCTVAAPNREGLFDHDEVKSIAQTLKSIEKQVRLFNELAIGRHNSKTEEGQARELEEVLRKQQVIDILKISDRTYYRHIENGILVPRQLGNRNYFYPSDLIDALEYSRVHGYL